MRIDQLVTFIRSHLGGAEGWIHPYHPLTAPKTSTDWDGDAFGTTAKTLMDRSAAFGLPAGVKAVDVAVKLNDSGSAGGDYYLILGPSNVAGAGRRVRCSGLPND